MVILQDRREQKPLKFPPHPNLSSVLETTLPVGDYMFEFTDGTRPPVAIERKSLPDLFGTFTKGYRRFKQELVRAHQAHIRLILVIEASMAEVYEGHVYTAYPGPAMLSRLFTMFVRHGLTPIFCADRTEAARWVLEYGCAVGREWVRQGGAPPARAKATTTEAASKVHTGLDTGRHDH